MRRRNPDATAVARRSTGLHLPDAVRRRRLWRRFGWPRGVRVRHGWFLGVDVTFASALWVARVHALPPRPAGSPHGAAGRAWLASLAALRGPAAAERAAAERARETGEPWPRDRSGG